MLDLGGWDRKISTLLNQPAICKKFKTNLNYVGHPVSKPNAYYLFGRLIVIMLQIYMSKSAFPRYLLLSEIVPIFCHIGNLSLLTIIICRNFYLRCNIARLFLVICLFNELRRLKYPPVAKSISKTTSASASSWVSGCDFRGLPGRVWGEGKCKNLLISVA